MILTSPLFQKCRYTDRPIFQGLKYLSWMKMGQLYGNSFIGCFILEFIISLSGVLFHNIVGLKDLVVMNQDVETSGNDLPVGG